jgi:hypothetical protein
MKETMHEALDIISDNFSWHATAEGRNYWSDIKRDMEENRNKYKRKMFAIS